MDSFVRAQEVMITIPHSEVPSSIEILKETAVSMAKALGLDPEQVEIGTIYFDYLFDEQASGGRRRLTEYVIIGYLIYLLENEQVSLSGADLAEAFIAQVETDLNIVYSAKVMDTVDYEMVDGFMEPTAVPRCRGGANCWNLQEGDGYCTEDDDCQAGLRCGTANCMDFRDKGNSDYYQVGGWADGGNCCYDELMFTAAVAEDGELILYVFIGGGVVALCLIVSMVYWIRRSSRKSQMAIGLEVKGDIELDNWTARGDQNLAPEGKGIDFEEEHQIILQSNPSSGFCSTEAEEQGEGEVEGEQKAAMLPLPNIVPTSQSTGGMQGEMSEVRYENADTTDFHSRSDSVFEVPKNDTSHALGGELSVMPKQPFNSEVEKVIPPLPVSAGDTSKGQYTELKNAEQLRVSLIDVRLSSSAEKISDNVLPTPGVVTPGSPGVNL